MGCICYSLKSVTPFYCQYLAETRPDSAIEIHLDTCGFTEEEIKETFSTPRESIMIATGKMEGEWDRDAAVRQLSAAILAGADCVELRLDMPRDIREWLTTLAFNKECLVMFSYYNSHETPSTEVLEGIANTAFTYGADVVKIVTAERSQEDCDRLISLYDKYKPSTLMAFAAGDNATRTLLRAQEKGAPFFYLSPRHGGETFTGELCYSDLSKPGHIVLRGEATMPGSSSMAQRSILMAALCEGPTAIFGVSDCAAVRDAISVARQLGADILEEEGKITVTGHQDIQARGLVAKDNIISVGESALLARYCIPLAGLSRRSVTVTGEGTLLAMEVNEYSEALSKTGLKVEYTSGRFLPVSVSGAMDGADLNLDGTCGPDMISGLVLALSQCASPSEVYVHNEGSQLNLDLAATIGSWFGMEDNMSLFEYDEFSRTFHVRGAQRLKPVGGMVLEGDWGCAAYLMAAAAIAGKVTFKGLKSDSEQAESLMMDMMDDGGIDIFREDNGDITVHRSIICPFSFVLADMPDLLAPLMILALRAGGESCLQGLYDLRKDDALRAELIIKEFRRIGADVWIEGNDIYIQGDEKLELRGGRCSSHGDPWLAVALQTVSIICRKPLRIDGIECAEKVFPGFFKLIESLRS
ncbi:MAG: type I 3-dehydroquinate dehydratase [Bacteroidales bacterium]|nr:type I 3-dehydroquinate dehydratase [Bacteroidales bacterium]